MPSSYVNLDALIPREDFESIASDSEIQPSVLGATIKINELGPESLTYSILRKPDFQRETANWTPEKVAELVASFLQGDLIPSVILWRSPVTGNIFVIDGAHRLSALIAWAHDDYGDKHTSLRFFDNYIPEDQKKVAEQTRRLISDSVGSYSDLSLALRNQDTASPDRLKMARNMNAFALSLQWVAGEAEKAESSFFRINQKATPIDSTELDMIKARHKPNALAARAFIRAGTGHKYWSSFEDSTRSEIESLGKEVYDLIFKPDIDPQLRTPDLPVAGRGYSADSVRMVFEFVNFANSISPDMWRSDQRRASKRTRSVTDANSEKKILSDDVDGSETVRFMRSVKKMSNLIAGKYPGSLGLHPAVYFYSATGRFQPASFLAAVAFVSQLEEKDAFSKFTEIRANFEDFLIQYKHFINQIVRSYGSMQRAVPHILTVFETIYECMRKEFGAAETVSQLQERLPLLKEITDDDRKRGRNFSANQKNAVIIRDVIASASRCGICGARLNLRSSTIDHVVRKEDGGLGAAKNGQLTHPYCNSGYKESGRSTTTRMNQSP